MTVLQFKMATVNPPTENQEEAQNEQIPQNTDAPAPQNDWEKPWPLDKIRKEASTWSLAGDSALLCVLKQFSQKMISKTHEIETEVDGVSHLTKTVGVNVNNVFNDFIMLANSQFVENRVYDEDVGQPEATTDTKPQQPEKTREEREAELVPLITSALKHGTDIIANYYDTLDVGVVDSDSDDDGEIPYRADPILEAKDPYVARPLPHIIGTTEFMQEEDVGLLEPPSDIEEETQGSMSESEESASEYSESEDEKPRADTKKRLSSVSESGSESESEEKKDLFGGESGSSGEGSLSESDNGSDADVKKEQKPVGGFSSELAAKIGAKTPAQPKDSESDSEVVESTKSKEKEHERHRTESGVSRRSKHSQKSRRKSGKKHEEADPFAVEDDDADPFFTKGGGLFSATSGGLFDDQPQSQGLFDDSDQEGKPAPKPTQTAKDDVDSLPNSIPKQSQKTPLTKQTSSSFFADDESDDDGDLFSAAPKRVKESRKKSRSSSGKDMFDSSLEASTAQKQEEPKKKKLPAGAVSMFGGGPDPMTESIRQRQSITEDDSATVPSTDQPHSTKSDPIPPEDHKSHDLPTYATNSIDRVKSRDLPTSASTNSLFASEPIDDSLFAPAAPTKPTSKSALFDDDDVNDLFAPTKTTTHKDKKAPAKNKAKSFLFDDDEDDAGDLFAGLSSPAKKRTTTGTSSAMFGVDDLSTSPPKPLVKKQEPAPAPVPAKSSATKISLFDDDEDDLFGTKPTDTKVTKPEPAVTSTQPKPRTKSLFDDDNDSLFGGDVSPTVDLFGGVITQKPAEKVNEKPKPVIGSASSDDSPLFAQKPSTEKSSATPTESPQPVHTPDTVDAPVTKKKLAGAVALFGGIDPFASSKKKTDVLGPSDDDDDLFAPKSKSTIDKNESTNTSVPTKTAKLRTTSDTPSEKDDLFKPAPAKPTKPRTISDALNDNSDLFQPKPTPRPVSDTPSENDLFKPTKTQNKTAEDILKITPTLSTKPSAEDVLKNTPTPATKPRTVSDTPSETDDLFKVAPVTAPKPRTISDTPSDADDLFKAPTKAPIKASKSRPTSDEANKPAPTTAPKPRTISDTPSDADDLFKAPIKASKSRPTSDEANKPTPAIAPKPRTISDTPSDADDLFKPPTKPPKSRPTSDEANKTAPTTAPKPRTISDPPSETDDLFKAPSKPPKPRTISDKSSDGEDLFAAKTIAAPVRNRPKLPPGAVSMFGGKDVFPPSQKLASSSDAETANDSTTHQASNHDKPSIASLQANLSINPATMLPGATPPSPDNESISPSFDVPAQADTLASATKSRAKIQQKRRPPTRALRTTSTEPPPPSPSTLPSVSVDKFSASLPNPPTTSLFTAPTSTKAFKPIGFKPQGPISATKTISKNTGASIPDTDTEKTSPAANNNAINHSTVNIENKSTSIFNNDVINSDDKFTKISNKTTKGEIKNDVKLAIPNDIFTDDKHTNIKTDIFATGSMLGDDKSNDIEKILPILPNSNLDDDIFSSTAFKKSAKTNNDLDDLFNVPTKKVVENVSDDMFASDVLDKPKDKSKDKPKDKQKDKPNDKLKDRDTTKGIPNDKAKTVPNEKTAPKHEVEDDLFASSILDTNKGGKSVKTTNATEKTAAKVEAVPKEEPPPKSPDDIFAEATKDDATTKKSTRKKKAKTKDEVLFSDDTDIFADIPAAAPKEKKKKKTTDKKSIFNDNVDDIFADVATTKPKTKKSASKKTVKAVEVTDDIFAGDNTGFDDPLKVLGQ